MRGVQGLVWIMVASFCVSLSQAQENPGAMCANFCPHGRMCTPHREGSREWTTCDCPSSCPSDDAPVCTYYNVGFSNVCEMHKFACEHKLTLRVKNAGPCVPASGRPDDCPERKMLGFSIRYLEWLMIAKGMSEDPNYKVTVRGEALSKKERTDVLVWEFMIIDKNKNDRIDEEESDSIVRAIQPREPCIESFIKSCDYNGDNAIEFREWVGCFPEGDSQPNIGSRLRL